jgi:hypothetical protein
MNPLYTQKEFNSCKSRGKLPLKCQYCNKIFYRTKNKVQAMVKEKTFKKYNYCSKLCHYKSRIKQIKLLCTQCNKITYKRPFEIKKSKSKNHFCSKSCAATYNNTHKTTGCRRSKLEVYLEQQLKILYPNFNILFNDKTTINSELDIYISKLKLAIELNGIFHYEPIYGQKKLSQTQNNDKRKFQACLEKNIELCIIDSSRETNFKEKHCKKYLDIITNIINQKLDAATGVEPDITNL